MRERVLILCTANSARSQMAEGLLRHDFGERFEVESAGTRASFVRPEAIAVMKEIGIDISQHRSKDVDEFRNQNFDYVLTVCHDAKENCPIFPGKLSDSTSRLRIPLQSKARTSCVLQHFERYETSCATTCAPLQPGLYALSRDCGRTRTT
jgi:protein-tyrosine-phosphatase